MNIETNSGVHSLLYHEDLRIFIVSGFEMSLYVYNLDPIFFDYQKLAVLSGHTSLIIGV
jgi:hypothetical protein